MGLFPARLPPWDGWRGTQSPTLEGRRGQDLKLQTWKLRYNFQGGPGGVQDHHSRSPSYISFLLKKGTLAKGTQGLRMGEKETPQKRGTTLPETVPWPGAFQGGAQKGPVSSCLPSFHPCRLEGPLLPDISGHFRRGGIFKGSVCFGKHSFFS